MRYRYLTTPVAFSGRGLHTGVFSNVTIFPGEPGAGVMIRTRKASFPLTECSSSGTGRGTDVFLPDGSSLKTTEHLFAALAGIGIWSGDIVVDGPEVPVLDGCAVAFAEALEKSSRPLGAAGPFPKSFALASPLTVEDRERGAVLVAFPCEDLYISYVISYSEVSIGTQMAEYRPSAGDFRHHLAPARTFALASEVQSLLDRGLARGGNRENTVIVGEQDVQATGGLRFLDEFVRHKILDLLGDLYLLGYPIRARIVALRAGHDLHCRLIERLAFLFGTQYPFKKGDEPCLTSRKS